MNTGEPPRHLAALGTVTGLAWAGLAGAFLLQPAVLDPDISFPVMMELADVRRFLEALPAHQLTHAALHAAALLASLLTFVWIPAVTAQLTRAHDALRAAAWLAMLGQGVMALSNVRYLALEPTLARLYASADADGQVAVASSATTLALDALGVLEFGAVGLWVILVAARRRAGVESALGVLCGVAYFGVVLGSVFASGAVLTWSSTLGGAAFPVWCVWLSRGWRSPRPPRSGSGPTP